MFVLTLILALAFHFQAVRESLSAVDTKNLGACADLLNLPFSNENGEGFE